MPMATTALALPPLDPSQVDQRVCLHEVGWADYETLLAMRGDQGGVRVTYLEGEIELMNRGRDARYRAPPAQIPACAIHAPGSHLG
jgi:hypothetical protein